MKLDYNLPYLIFFGLIMSKENIFRINQHYVLKYGRIRLKNPFLRIQGIMKQGHLLTKVDFKFNKS